MRHLIDTQSVIWYLDTPKMDDGRSPLLLPERCDARENHSDLVVRS
jgi:hypothetical protein